MDFYRHINPDLTRQQQENYVRLGRHLVMTVDAPKHETAEFNIMHIAMDLMTGDDLAPDQVAGHKGPLMCNPLGHGPRAGITALPGETWRDYQLRAFGAAFDSPLEDWVFSRLWAGTDDTAVGAAMRLMYVLDYGVPGDWEAIIHGQARSDYLSNGFLWDRLGMMPPKR